MGTKPPWYPRIADIPGMDYAQLAEVDRASLPMAKAKPISEEFFDIDGRRHYMRNWPSPDGETSASPVHQRTFAESGRQSPDEIVQELAETLELPGEASDYHFAIQSAADRLWGLRGQHPAAYDHIERIYRLDLALLDAVPAIGVVDDADEPVVLRIQAFDRLATLYEREGFLKEALELVERDIARGGVPEDAATKLRERLANQTEAPDGISPP